jgi:hypothetical protein
MEGSKGIKKSRGRADFGCYRKLCFTNRLKMVVVLAFKTLLDAALEL